jgi:hypothetical protein
VHVEKDVAMMSTKYAIIIYHSFSLANYFVDVDDCVRVTCSFHGTCVDGVNSHTCSCEHGYTGDNCETGKFLEGRLGMHYLKR